MKIYWLNNWHDLMWVKVKGGIIKEIIIWKLWAENTEMPNILTLGKIKLTETVNTSFRKKIMSYVGKPFEQFKEDTLKIDYKYWVELKR